MSHAQIPYYDFIATCRVGDGGDSDSDDNSHSQCFGNKLNI